MILKKKEIKSYGTKKILEGVYERGQKCLIIEDVVTTGSSVLETAKVLKDEGLLVTDCIVMLDRQEGGDNLKKAGITMHSLFQLEDLITTLSTLNLVTSSVLEEVKLYLEKSKVTRNIQTVSQAYTFHQRSETCSNLVLKKLFKIIETKESNLCIAIDVTMSTHLLQLVEVLGPHMCILKTHIDMLQDFEKRIALSLKELAMKHNFLILEDRKFADIGNTVMQQYKAGMYKIHDWADMVTVHSLPGESVVEALRVTSSGHKACLLIGQMSSKGALTGEDYAKETVALAEKNKDFVIGFISQSRISNNENFVHISPGVNLESSGDSLGQQYRSVDEAIVRDGVDIVIVGRGITHSSNVVDSAVLYKTTAFDAYAKRIVQ